MSQNEVKKLTDSISGIGKKIQSLILSYESDSLIDGGKLFDANKIKAEALKELYDSLGFDNWFNEQVN